jgi:hypothetical protein
MLCLHGYHLLLPFPLGRLLTSAKITHALPSYSSVGTLPSADTLRPAPAVATLLNASVGEDPPRTIPSTVVPSFETHLRMSGDKSIYWESTRQGECCKKSGHDSGRKRGPLFVCLFYCHSKISVVKSNSPCDLLPPITVRDSDPTTPYPHLRQCSDRRPSHPKQFAVSCPIYYIRMHLYIPPTSDA